MTVLVDHASEDFRRLCNRLEENDEGLAEITAVLIPRMQEDDFFLLVQRLAANTTVQDLSIIFMTPLSSAQFQALGRVFINNTKITDFLLICNPRVEAIDMRPLWEGLLQSKALKNISMNGFQTQHNAIGTFLSGWNGFTQPNDGTTPGIHLSNCFIGTLETDAIVTMLQKEDMIKFQFYIYNCQFDLPENSTDPRQRIAKALAHNTTVKSFDFRGSLEDHHSACAQSFGHAMAVNKTLHSVGFVDCGDLAVPLITQGIVQNHRLASAKVKGSSLPPSVQIQECQRQINHSIEMNRAGRYFMYDCASQDGEMELDSTWLRLLIQNIGEKHAIIYSWLRDYVDIFTRLAMCGMAGQKRRATASNKGDDGRGPSKRAKTGSS
ncbi:expressed unknown protein [Seminavis robusta]|uniref:Uncharacterized protein n=1 Tax=Seminavis robusta TaxID=568900 RepID=A0A9N8DNU4_9STRA|nr:expressed unknown protein [Seminavis robusta]|eukprot:Sro158_g071620.1 n/a (380) ;mRNA; r:64652-65791